MIRFAVRDEQRESLITEKVIIGAPGTVLGWANRFFDLRKIKVFVMDEADEMIATQGHQEETMVIFENLGGHCQTLLFSATYDQDVLDLAMNIIDDPLFLKLRREEESRTNIDQYYVFCDTPEAKYRSMAAAISIGQAIVFCRTRKTASRLVDKMKGWYILYGSNFPMP